jgi:glycosyltransferase involved in cell wall biosynthesis
MPGELARIEYCAIHAAPAKARRRPMAAPVQISVVIPTHNRRELTLRAVASVLAQQPGDGIEVLVVDDGSTDGTAVALRECYGDDARLSVIASARVHASAARNLGFARARGEFVCFLDSDDCWLPGTLQAVLRVFAADPGLAFVSVDGATMATAQRPALERIVAGDSPGWSHAAFRRVKLESRTIDLPGNATPTLLLRGDFFPAIINGDMFYLSGLVMRRASAATAGGFNERFRFFNDWEFFARLCLQGPGTYLAWDGFRRDTGRTDQISRNRPATAMPRRHLFILRSLLRNSDGRIAAHRPRLYAALVDAHYSMGRRLIHTSRRRWARKYLYYSLRHGHKMLRSLALLIGLHPDGDRSSQVRTSPAH